MKKFNFKKMIGDKININSFATNNKMTIFVEQNKQL